MTDIIILDLATTTTLLHENVANTKDGLNLDIGIIYFNRKKYDRSPLKKKYFISLTREASSRPYHIYSEIEGLSEIKTSRALYLDRYIGNKDLLHKYCDHYLTELDKILKSERPRVFIGELSLSWEILTYGLCQARNIYYLLPLNTYIFPRPRLSFFNINHDSEIIRRIANNKRSEVSDDDLMKLISTRRASDINKGFGEKIRKTLNVDIIKRFAYNVFNRDKNDYREDNIRKTKVRLNSIIYGKINNAFLRRVGCKPDNDKCFTIFLHVQPEVTPDTTATFFSNQEELIRQFCLRMPYGYKLLVKEHPNGQGCRTIGALKKIASLPNTHFLHPDVSAREAILASKGVITIGGTASYEAALYGVPSAVFNEVYFGDIEGIHKLKSYQEIDSFIKFCEDWQVSGAQNHEIDIIKSLKVIYNGSFDCYWHQPFLMPGVLNSGNIKAIRKAIHFTCELLTGR